MKKSLALSLIRQQVSALLECLDLQLGQAVIDQANQNFVQLRCSTRLAREPAKTKSLALINL
jgi:hypothetical protein